MGFRFWRFAAPEAVQNRCTSRGSYGCPIKSDDSEHSAVRGSLRAGRPSRF